MICEKKGHFPIVHISSIEAIKNQIDILQYFFEFR